MNSGEHPAPLSVILADDDNLFREALTANLINEGFAVKSFGGGQDVLESISRDGTDGVHVILLDLKMPGMSGLEVMKAIRVSGVTLPVIILNDHPYERYEQAALDSGAVDFVDKTRNVSILIARIRIAATGIKVPRGIEMPCVLVNIGDLQLNVQTARACWKEKVVLLTLTQFQVVHLLVSNAGTHVPYREIYDVVHGIGFHAGDGEFGYRVTVRTLIKRIRQRFRKIDRGFNEILNYPACGYGWSDGNEDPSILALNQVCEDVLEENEVEA